MTTKINGTEMRAEWIAAGGEIHGPNVETVTMPEADYFRFRVSLEAALPHLQPAKPEAVRLRDELRERAEFDRLHAIIGAANLWWQETGHQQFSGAPEWVPQALQILDEIDSGKLAWQAALAATGKQQVPDSVIRDVFLRNGFTIKDGRDDLKPYVYAAARELLGVGTAGKQQVGEVQGVDLGQFRDSVIHECLRAHAEWQGDLMTYDEYLAAEQKRDHLLALIDGQAEVSNGAA